MARRNRTQQRRNASSRRADGFLTSRSFLNFRQVEVIDLNLLKPSPRNARTHSREQVARIARSIEEFGFTSPILVDRHNQICAGTGRWLASRKLGLKKVPVIRLEDLTPEQIRAYALADNRLAEDAGWDRDTLALELKELSALNLDFDVELTGFAVAEIDQIVADGSSPGGQREEDIAADVPAIVDRSKPALTKIGDVWRLGTGRLVCADCRDARSFDTLMKDERASAVISDPPYNISVTEFLSARGRTKHRNFAMASGEMTEEAFQDFLREFLERARAASTEAALTYVFMDWRHITNLVAAGEALGLRLLNICVWVKRAGGMGSFYRSQHEFIAVFGPKSTTTRNNVQLGKFGRSRTNVWHYAGSNALTVEGRETLALHPTVKPVAMIADAILDATAPGEIVLDPFAGSGTVFVAAFKTRRRGFGIEIDPHYVDAVVKRWENYTGEKAVHEETGLSFEALLKRRAHENLALAGEQRSTSAVSRKRR